MICVYGNQSSIPLAAILILNSGPEVADVRIYSSALCGHGDRSETPCAQIYSLPFAFPHRFHKGPAESSL